MLDTRYKGLFFFVVMELKPSPRFGKLFSWGELAGLEKDVVCVQPSFLAYLFLRKLCSWGRLGWQPSVERRKAAVWWELTEPAGGEPAGVLSDDLHYRPSPDVPYRGMCVTHKSWTRESVAMEKSFKAGIPSACTPSFWRVWNFPFAWSISLVMMLSVTWRNCYVNC